MEICNADVDQHLHTQSGVLRPGGQEAEKIMMDDRGTQDVLKQVIPPGITVTAQGMILCTVGAERSDDGNRISLPSGTTVTTQEMTLHSLSDFSEDNKSDNGSRISSSTTSNLATSMSNPGATRPKLLAELTSVSSVRSASNPMVSTSGSGSTQVIGKDKVARSESPIIIIENISKVFPVPFQSRGQSKATVQNLTSKESQLNIVKAIAQGKLTSVKRTAIHVSSASQESPVKQAEIAQSDIGRSSKDVFRCDDCDYTSYNKHYLKQHVDLVHHADRPFKCPFCDYAGKRSHSLREHLIVHSNERPYECTHCNATFRKKGHLTNHTKLHQKTVFCNTCRKSIVHAELETHMKACHARDNVFVCELCSFVAADEDMILEHIKVHQSQQIYVCSSCKHMTSDFAAFVAHAETHQATPSSSTVCSAELKSASVKADLKQTILSKRLHDLEQVKDSPSSKPKPVLLEFPSLQPSKQDLLLKCSECGFVAPTTNLMKNHMWTHLQVMDKPPSLSQEENVSPKASPDKSSVQEKSVYKCVECDFMCDEAYNFVVHMLAHKPELQHSNVQSVAAEQMKPMKKVEAEKPTSSMGLAAPVQAPSSSSASSTSSSTVTSSEQESPTAVINDPDASSGIRQDLKDSILAKQQKVPALQEVLNKKYGELPPFVHDRVNARYLCTICGYTCEFQRTIKAHIWKHSGNKDIEYPMFQNGPLSIYDSDVETKACVNLTPKSVFMVEKEQKTSHEPDHNVELPPVCKESVTKVTNNPQTTSSVSPVAPALAHLLAARAMTGLTQEVTLSRVTRSEVNNRSEVTPKKEDQICSEVSPDKDVPPKQVMKPSPKSFIVSMSMEKPEKVNILREKVYVLPQEVNVLTQKGDVSAEIANTSVENANVVVEDAIRQDTDVEMAELQNDRSVSSSAEVSSRKKEKKDGRTTSEETAVDKVDEDKQDVESPKISDSVSGQTAQPVTKKRKLYESKYDVNEMLQMVKRFCAPEDEGSELEDVTEKGNVVVETVDSISSLSGLTGMKSQQGSPRTCAGAPGSTEGETAAGLEQDMECGDSGFMSDTNSSQSQEVSKVEHAYVATRSSTRLSARSKRKSSSVLRSIDENGCQHSRGLTTESVKSDRGLGTSSKRKNTEADDDDLDENKVDEEEKREETEEDEEDKPSSMAESAVTLLSLLKKGPNHNPACPSATEEIVDRGNEDGEVRKDERNSSKVKKPKSRGISSSLLAVIEQLRERSRSEMDGDEPGKKNAKKKFRHPSAEVGDPLEDMDNVERIEEAEDDESRFRCKFCHYSNSSSFVMKQHMRLHKTKRPFECSLCDFIADSSEELQNHMIKHCKVRTYQCKLCPSAFNYKSQLRAHMRAHNEKDVFACEECEFETGNPNLLRNHMNICHEIKQYVCEVCELRFASKQQLRTHKKLTCQGQEDRSLSPSPVESKKQSPDPKTQGKCHKFRCAKCDYITNSFVRFGNHMKTHEEPKVLKCDLCDFPAVSNRSLKSHMKRHINDQRFVQQPLEQYKCNLCGYVCHHLPSLKSHMWRHASDQNYSYEFTNEVINAAIDYDSRLDIKECSEEDVAEFNKTIREKMRVRLANQGVTKEADSLCAVCWVTFRCCQCGFEVINKAQLNLHMKTHSDVIQWTLQVSQNNTSASGVSGQSGASTADSSDEQSVRSDRKGLEIR